MSITHDILNIDGTAFVDVVHHYGADKADFVLVDTVQNASGREATYQKVSGEEEYPMTVRIGHYPNPKGNGGNGQTNISVKVSTFVRKMDGATEVWVLPCTMTLASSLPGLGGIADPDDYIVLVQNLVSWLIPVATGEYATAAADELKFGVVNGLAAHIDS